MTRLCSIVSGCLLHFVFLSTVVVHHRWSNSGRLWTSFVLRYLTGSPLELGTHLYGCCGAYPSLLPLVVCYRAAPLRLAGALVHHRGCEWYQWVRTAIAHPYLASNRTAVA